MPMNKTRLKTALLLLLLFLGPAGIAGDLGTARARPPDGEAIYTYSTPSRDGIGKLYMGREIAQVMGHRGA